MPKSEGLTPLPSSGLLQYHPTTMSFLSLHQVIFQTSSDIGSQQRFTMQFIPSNSSLYPSNTSNSSSNTKTLNPAVASTPSTRHTLMTHGTLHSVSGSQIRIFKSIRPSCQARHSALYASVGITRPQNTSSAHALAMQSSLNQAARVSPSTATVTSTEHVICNNHFQHILSRSITPQRTRHLQESHSFHRCQSTSIHRRHFKQSASADEQSVIARASCTHSRWHIDERPLRIKDRHNHSSARLAFHRHSQFEQRPDASSHSMQRPTALILATRHSPTHYIARASCTHNP